MFFSDYTLKFPYDGQDLKHLTSLYSSEGHYQLAPSCAFSTVCRIFWGIIILIVIILDVCGASKYFISFKRFGN